MLFIVAFGVAKLWRNPRGVGNITPFHTFLFITNYDLVAMLLLGISFKSIGGLGAI
jgi:K+ transporter